MRIKEGRKGYIRLWKAYMESRVELTVLQANPSHTEYSLKVIYNLQFEESNFWFDIYSFISLLLFNKNNTWRSTCFIVQMTGFNRLAKFLS